MRLLDWTIRDSFGLVNFKGADSSVLVSCVARIRCWDTGGLKRAQKAENMFHLQEDDNRQVSRQAKKERAAASYVEKKRREARP